MGGAMATLCALELRARGVQVCVWGGGGGGSLRD